MSIFNSTNFIYNGLGSIISIAIFVAWIMNLIAFIQNKAKKSNAEFDVLGLVGIIIPIVALATWFRKDR